MTIPDAPPDWPRIARDLLHRAEKARHTWRTPAHQLAASPDALAAARQTDIDNAQVLDAIVARHGWPGRARVGEDGCQAAVLIALHADHDRNLQSRLLHSLHQAATRGEATRAQWAHLQDRLLVNVGRPQLYGTQYAYRPAPDGGRLELLPVHELESLDHRRDQVVLPPHGEQAQRLRRHHLASLSTTPVVRLAERPAV
ncbi:hypothetical protein SUDANB106_05177 [Streptomyces sp. enrichment culture]|uniref:DUF6624 domain-containing protein n=1 Tax=Streptomyces sp. enrichment culture TaxID=1795815 RepID=UPI003F546C9B